MSQKKYKTHPKRYPDEMRLRMFELWLTHGRNFYTARRYFKLESGQVPGMTTIQTWAAQDGWEARAERVETRLTSFTGFKQYVWQPYQHAPHLELIDTKLTELVRYIDTGGQEGRRRLMIFMPPRHGKSMTVSKLFPAWFLGTHPDYRVILTCYAMSLAAHHSMMTRNLVRSMRYRELFPRLKIAREMSSAAAWNLKDHEGGLEAMGIRGPIMGKGAHVLIIDDPVKNREAAWSRYQREKMWQNYQTDLYTRLEPNAVIVLMMTRWHEDDLAGRLLRSEGEKWEVIKLPAIAEEVVSGQLSVVSDEKREMRNEKGQGIVVSGQLSVVSDKQPQAASHKLQGKDLNRQDAEKGIVVSSQWSVISEEPKGVDVLGRKAGEALWAERFPVSELEEIRSSVGPLAWSALYQQNPMPQEGGLFRLGWIEDKRDENVPPLARIYVSIDPAAGSGERAAETGIIVAGVDRRNPSHAYVLADLSVKATPAEWGRIALEAVKTWKADAIVLEVNQGGEMAAGTLKAIDPRVRIQTVRATRDKFLRADPVAALYEQGRVHHAGVFPKLEDQMVRWTPGDPSPDRLDALVWGLTELMLTVQGVGLR